MVKIEHAEHLGSPLGDDSSVEACVSEKMKLLEVMGDRLSHLHSHDALSLLRHSFAIPKMCMSFVQLPLSIPLAWTTTITYYSPSLVEFPIYGLRIMTNLGYKPPSL